MSELLSPRVVHARLDDYLKANCPNCGLAQDVDQRRFFGRFSPKVIRGFTLVLVIAALVAIASAIRWNWNHFYRVN